MSTNAPILDFREAVIASLDRLVASDTVTKAIDAALETCVKRVINDELQSYSEFGKRLTAAVKESLRFNDHFDLPSYNDAILKIVRRQVETYTTATIQRQVAEQLEDLLSPAPESIELSKLVETYLKQVKRKADTGCHCGPHEIGFKVRDTDYGFRYIELSETNEKPSYARQADINLGVTKEGEVFSLSFGSTDVERQMFVGPFYGFERMLFQMKAAKSRIVFDEEPEAIQTYYGHPD